MMKRLTSKLGINKTSYLSSPEKKSCLFYFWKDKYLYLLMLPVLLHIFIFCYLPMYGILIAFQNYKPGSPFLSFNGGVEWVGLKHFINYFESIYFARTLRNTILNSLLSLVFGFWVPIVFALLLNEIRNSVFKKVAQTFSYLPHFISTVIIAGIVVNFLAKSDGIVNVLLENMGMDKIGFLQEPKYFRIIYVLTGVWQTFGWNSVLYLASIASIDPGMYESARLDGANRFQQAIHITIPGISSTIIILLIFAIGGILSADSEKILLLYNPAVYETADVIGTYTYRSGILGSKYSYSTAIGLFTSLVNLMLLTVANKISRKTVDYGLW